MRLTGRDRGGWRRAAGAALALALLLAPAGAWCEPGATRIVLLAIDGLDPVSYFLPGGPLPGRARYETDWGGRVWRFAIEANRAAFTRDPGVYAPRLGGYDAAGVLEHRIVDADPSVFAILGGRLYLFRDEKRRARFLDDPALADKAEAIWPELADLLEDPADVGASKAPVRPQPGRPSKKDPR